MDYRQQVEMLTIVFIALGVGAVVILAVLGAG